MDPEITIIEAAWPEEADRLLAVRHRVFVKEQRVPEEIEVDEHDETAFHLLAVNGQNEPLGTARWMSDGDGVRVGRVAVLKAWRRHGIGSLLMKEVIRSASEAGHRRLHLHAQTSSIPFYEALGFQLTNSPEFEEAGIPHREMEFLL
ncbi:MAG: GNAT family N-acetyltransferase [Verrucomicrobiales bacterium]|nr:GNAT family N-acetyltransferase [Verrucomicrobiales bacterium]